MNPDTVHTEYAHIVRTPGVVGGDPCHLLIDKPRRLASPPGVIHGVQTASRNGLAQSFIDSDRQSILEDAA